MLWTKDKGGGSAAPFGDRNAGGVAPAGLFHNTGNGVATRPSLPTISRWSSVGSPPWWEGELVAAMRRQNRDTGVYP